MPGLLLPVANYSGLSSWRAHINRTTPSSEPGTDLYCPIGTHILAPADGYIWGSGESITPATGRWVGINFDNGMSFRSMHHSRNRITSGRVKRGDVIAFSGASGYGEEDWSWNVAETGGAHTHVTLWPTHEHRYGYRSPGMPYTIDFMLHVDGALAAGGSTAFPTTASIDHALLRRRKEQDMYVASTEAQAIVYVNYTDRDGRQALRLAGTSESAWARQGGLVIFANPDALKALATEGGYYSPKVTTQDAVWRQTIAFPGQTLDALQTLASIRSEQIADNAAPKA